jgi:ketosteroid isomerase-like protein
MGPLLFRLALLGLVVSASGAHAQGPASADSARVVAAVEAFHAALASGDSAAALLLLAPDVQVLESGHIETLAQYRTEHLPADIGFARAVVTERRVLAVTVADSVAWVSASSESRGTYRDRPIDSIGVELMVLSLGADGWRIRAIHWSSRTRRRS